MSGKLFDSNTFEDEIYRSMEKQLVAKQVEEKHGLKKLAQAIDCLNSAADIFEQAGLTDQVDDITNVLASLNDELGAK